MAQATNREGNGTPLRTLAWKIPWTEEPGRLQSFGLLRLGHDWVTSLLLFTFMHWRRKWQPAPMFLPGESQGQWSLMGCCLWGHTESDMTEATWQQQQQQATKEIEYGIFGYRGGLRLVQWRDWSSHTEMAEYYEQIFSIYSCIQTKTGYRVLSKILLATYQASIEKFMSDKVFSCRWMLQN